MAWGNTPRVSTPLAFFVLFHEKDTLSTAQCYTINDEYVTMFEDAIAVSMEGL